MDILPDPIAFEWDKGNIDKNLKKHQITIQEAEELFSNEPFTIVEDVKHSTVIENRFQGLGKTNTNRKLFVVFTIRNDKIRIISVRDMSRKEEAIYEKFETNS